LWEIKRKLEDKIKTGLKEREVRRCGPDQVAKSCECSNQTYDLT